VGSAQGDGILLPTLQNSQVECSGGKEMSLGQAAIVIAVVVCAIVIARTSDCICRELANISYSLQSLRRHLERIEEKEWEEEINS
jgi:hypothetical protein